MKSSKLFFSLLLMLFASSSAEIYTSFVELEKLLKTESEVVKSLDDYLEAEEKRIEEFRRLRQKYIELYNTAVVDEDAFLSNPLNVYYLVRHLTTDFKNMENFVEANHNKGIINKLRRQQNLLFPDNQDLQGTRQALVRLQSTYLLNITALSRGLIEGSPQTFKLAARDCYAVGEQAFNEEEYSLTRLWMEEALNKFLEGDNDTLEKEAIVEKIIYSSYMDGNTSHALNLMNEISDSDYFKKTTSLKHFRNILFKADSTEKSDVENTTEETPENFSSEWENYEKLCRGVKLKPVHEESKLHCQYHTNDCPYLLLQPAKEEELNLSPRIVIYHDVLSDNEIEVLKKMAIPRLETSAVSYGDQDDSEAEAGIEHSVRISKVAWLRDEEHEVVSRLSQRIEDITGLSTETAEELQVANYGIGGYFISHYDFAYDPSSNTSALGTGERVATWLSYMNDVQAGGATVFLEAEVAVTPKKGAAAFWYNLLNDGSEDFSSLHAACPVLSGSKWASNKWIREHGQEFRRKCNLKQPES